VFAAYEIESIRIVDTHQRRDVTALLCQMQAASGT
jgi:hypothetical protein